MKGSKDWARPRELATELMAIVRNKGKVNTAQVLVTLRELALHVTNGQSIALELVKISVFKIQIYVSVSGCVWAFLGMFGYVPYV